MAAILSKGLQRFPGDGRRAATRRRAPIGYRHSVIGSELAEHRTIGSSLPEAPVARSRAMAGRDFGVMAALGIAPLLIFSVAALAGYPLLTGDNLVQNYPLSVLAGEIIAHGNLPVYDPYLWSGSPLLGAANAHALLPTTGLFVFLPHLAAWVLDESVTLAACSVGAFVLARRNGCGTFAASLAGASFALGGFVSSQIIHIDFVSAAGALVWCLVAMDGIFTGDTRRRAVWAAVLAGAVACVALSGSPDIVIDAAVAVLAYGAHLLASARRGRLAPLAWTAAGGVSGIALGAVQWLPTADFVAASERAHASYAFAASGSVSPAELLLSVVPHVLGGGPIGLEAYAGPYNLAELDAYCGILGLVAVISLTAAWRSARAVNLRVWYVVGALGVLLALGSHTPLEHLVQHLPVVGEQRLPSRALILLSLASSMLVGQWVEVQLSAPRRAAPRLGMFLGALAPAAVLALLLATAVSGRPLGGLLGAVPGSHWSLTVLAPYLAVTAVVALGAGAVVLLGPGWPRRRQAWAIAVVFAVDLAVFTVDQSSLAPVYARALSAPNPLQSALAARLRGAGRYLVVDPGRAGGITLDEVGGSDFNLLSGMDSAQGYGSLTWGPYAAETGTHSQDDIAPPALAGTVFDSLDVRLLLVAPEELSMAGASAEPPGAAPASSPGLDLPAIAGVAPVASPVSLAAGQRQTRWFGRSLEVSSVILRVADPPLGPGEAAAIAAGLRLLPEAPGRTRDGFRSEASGGTLTLRLDRARQADGLELTDGLGSRLRIASVSLGVRGGASYQLDGALAAFLTGPHWVAAGHIGPYAVFADTRARGEFSVAVPDGPRVEVTVLSSSRFTPTETVRVVAGGPVSLDRAVADIPGWSASESDGGHSHAVALRRAGLVQSFSVPAGTTVVTFSYQPPGLRAGAVASLCGLVAIVLILIVGLALRRRGRHKLGLAG